MNGMMAPEQPMAPMPPAPNSAPGVVGGTQDTLDEGASVVNTMHNRLQAFAKQQPEVLEQVQEMLTPEVGMVIGVLFGVEPLKILAPMINRDMVSKAVPKGAMERIGLDKFESMMTKANERASGMMAPRKQASGDKSDTKATQS